MERTVNTLGGALWINLANTIRMQDKRRTDRLLDPAAEREWLEDNGLSAFAETVPAETAHDLLVELRELIFRVLADLERNGELSKESLRLLQERAASLTLEMSFNQEEGSLKLSYMGKAGPDAVAYPIVRSLADTLATVPADRIRKCEHDDCLLRFVDTSKSGKRRWCSMETCGNRHKAAEFYAKRRRRAEG